MTSQIIFNSQKFSEFYILNQNKYNQKREKQIMIHSFWWSTTAFFICIFDSNESQGLSSFAHASKIFSKMALTTSKSLLQKSFIHKGEQALANLVIIIFSRYMLAGFPAYYKLISLEITSLLFMPAIVDMVGKSPSVNFLSFMAKYIALYTLNMIFILGEFENLLYNLCMLGMNAGLYALSGIHRNLAESGFQKILEKIDLDMGECHGEHLFLQINHPKSQINIYKSFKQTPISTYKLFQSDRIEIGKYYNSHSLLSIFSSSKSQILVFQLRRNLTLIRRVNIYGSFNYVFHETSPQIALYKFQNGTHFLQIINLITGNCIKNIPLQFNRVKHSLFFDIDNTQTKQQRIFTYSFPNFHCIQVEDSETFLHIEPPNCGRYIDSLVFLNQNSVAYCGQERIFIYHAESLAIIQIIDTFHNSTSLIRIQNLHNFYFLVPFIKNFPYNMPLQKQQIQYLMKTDDHIDGQYWFCLKSYVAFDDDVMTAHYFEKGNYISVLAGGSVYFIRKVKNLKELNVVDVRLQI